MKRWIIAIATWLPAYAVRGALILIGFIVVPVGLLTRHLTMNATEQEKRDHWPDIFWLWWNDEEGIPQWWLDRVENLERSGVINRLRKAFPNFWWLAVRNPTNNFRYLFDEPIKFKKETNWSENMPMEPANLLRAGQDSAYRWVWSGLFYGYRKVWVHDLEHYSEVWFGWKIGSTVPGLGLTSQIRYRRPIGD